MAHNNQLFTTVRTEGALLPPDILQRIASQKVDGMRPTDYHLPEDFKSTEAIAQSWDMLKKHWKSFQEAREHLADSETGTSLTNERWLLPLFQQLDYGRLTTQPSPVIEDRSYPIERFYNNTPIHLIGCNLHLDRRTRGARGAATASPHSMVQEYLNRSDDHLWAFLSNGRQLRLLRDNVALSRQAFVEFDLEAMMEGEVYSDFALLWMLCHQSRLEAEKTQDCWLEKWSKLAREEGTRVLNNLRTGVANAIEALGRGFIGHPHNDDLRRKLQESGDLSKDDFYRQLLRIVYRLLFLFVAEDRELLHPPDADEKAKDLYRKYYSTSRLRDMSLKLRGSKHGDLWHSLSLVCASLGKNEGCPQLGLVGLGSFLWNTQCVADLAGPHEIEGESVPVQIANDDLLTAIRALAYVEQDKVLRSVDYRNLGSEELGSVYESLLELHPDMHVEARHFELRTAAGNERKTTGSYYTPDSLVQCLLDSALDPVVNDRLEDARRMASGKWPVEEKHSILEKFREALTQGTELANHILSRAGGLETRDGDRETGLQHHKDIPEGGTIRVNQPDAPRGRVDSLQSGGRLGESREQGVPAIHSSGAGEPEGTGNAAHSQQRSGADTLDQHSTDPPGNRDPGETTRRLIEKPEILERLFHDTPFAIRHSLLAEQALLALKVCDPACGSGHFLIAAAHRLARHLARVRTGESEPSPEDHQHALRDVIGRCIYGVDINPMAVELCKVSLWMEAIEPGKPLSFLDHHIQCGNSLLGTTPKLLAEGIPDDAFKPIEGDVKAVVNELKKQNKKQRTDRSKRQGYLFEPLIKLGNIGAEFSRLTAAGDDTVTEVAEKERRYAQLVSGADYLNARLLADTWCAAFVWQKDSSDLGKMCPTERDFRNIENNPHSILPHVKTEVRRLADQYQYFHWHLAFPDVFRLPEEAGKAENEQTGWNHGFDVVLGNPPWEHSELKEKEWFAEKAPEIANAKTANTRKKLIGLLQETDPPLFARYISEKCLFDGLSHFAGDGGRFPRCGRGRINLYAIFAETMFDTVNLDGRVGAILPTGIATDDTTKLFFQFVLEREGLVSLFDFWNRKSIFKGVQQKIKFCLLTLAGSGQSTFTLGAQMEDPAQIKDSNRIYTLTAIDVMHINPNTMNCPIFSSAADAELNKRIYKQFDIITREHSGTVNSWGLNFRQGQFNMTSDSGLFRTLEQLQEDGFRLRGNAFENGNQRFLPLYEAKLIHQFDHRAATFEGVPDEARFKTHAWANDPTVPQISNPRFQVWPRFWIRDSEVTRVIRHDGPLVGFRNAISTVADSRTFIASALPTCGVGNSMPICWSDSLSGHAGIVLSLFNSIVLDYVVRQKASGGNLNFYVVKQLPIPKPATFSEACRWNVDTDVKSWLNRRVLELTYTAWDLEAFALDCGYAGPPFRWDEERRFLLRCELDAAYFHLYLGANSEWGREASSESRMASGEKDHSPFATHHSPSTANSPDGKRPITNPQLLEMFPTPRDAVDYIMETFPIVKRKDIKRTAVSNEQGEITQPGTYITKETILAIYDKMAEVMQTNHELRRANPDKSDAELHSQFATYHSPLNPPPGPPTDAEGNFIPLSQWDPNNWPSHIHAPRN